MKAGRAIISIWHLCQRQIAACAGTMRSRAASLTRARARLITGSSSRKPPQSDAYCTEPRCQIVNAKNNSDDLQKRQIVASIMRAELLQIRRMIERTQLFRRLMQGRRGRDAAQFENLVLELKLSAFEFCQFQLVDGGMDEGFFNFLIERVVALLERGQMIFEGHAELLVEVLARQGVCHSFLVSRRPSRRLGANFMKLRCRTFARIFGGRRRRRPCPKPSTNLFSRIG
jgi:hypothetical protein